MSSAISDPLKDICDYIKRFNPDDLLNYITVTASLPDNEMHCFRFEVLFKLVISIRAKKFQNNPFTEINAEDLFKKLGLIENWDFLEDFIPVDTLNNPPLWILGKRFRILSGIEYRSFEYWKEIVADYFPLQKNFSTCGYDPIKIIIEVLSLQTKIIELLESRKEKYKISSKISTPTDELVTKWLACYTDWHNNSSCKDFFDGHSVKLGQNISYKQIFEQEPIHSLYKYYSININDSFVAIPQHCIFGFLNQLFIKDLKELKKTRPNLKFDLSHRLYDKLHKLFHPNHILPNFAVGDSDMIAFAVLFDLTKMFLFKVIDVDFSKDPQKDIELAVNQLENIDKKILSGNKNFSINGKSLNKVPPEQIETLPFILIKSTKPRVIFSIPESSFTEQKVLTCMLVDFISLADDIDSGMEFLKFIRQYRDMCYFTSPSLVEFLDHYAYYRQNADCLVDSETLMGATHFISGSWGKYFVKKLKEKPDFQPRFSSNEPDDAWEINEIEDKIFQAANRLLGRDAGIFLLSDNRDIWITTAGDYIQCTSDEVGSFEFLTRLIPYRFTKSTAFEELLEKLDVTKDVEIALVLHPVSAIQRKPLPHLNNSALQISSITPIVIASEINTNNNHHIFNVVYSLDILNKLFDDGSVNAEKAIIRSLLRGIAEHFKINSVENGKLVDNCIAELFKNAQSYFNLNEFNHELFLPNSPIEGYIQTLQSDISKVYKKISIFLNSKNISSGIYKNEQAKEIMDIILKFLNDDVLYKELADLDIEKALQHALNVEGNLIQSKKVWRQRTIYDLGYIHGFDLKEKYLKKNREISIISNTVSFICEKITQITPKSDSVFTLEKWYEIQGIGKVILALTLIRNWIYFEISDLNLRIYDDFKFEFVGVGTESLKHFIKNYDLESLKTGKKLIQCKNTAESVESYDGLEEPFRSEYGVGFCNFMKILRCCKFFPITHNVHTIKFTEDEFSSYVNDKWPEITKEEISNALNLATLSKENLCQVHIYPTDGRNRMERSVVKPIFQYIKDDKKLFVMNSWLVDISINEWLNNIDQGHLPFKHENYLKPKGFLRKKLQDMAYKAAKQHEKNVESIVKEKTKYFEQNLDRNQRCLRNIAEFIPGEIDNLSVYPQAHEIVLIDAKNLQFNIGPQQIRSEIDEYMDEQEGYFAKLDKKKKYVRKHLESILDYYDISHQGESWTVRGMIVTRIAGFVTSNMSDNKVIDIDNLKEELPLLE